MKAPVRVTVTGAAGQIGYAILFRIASGAMLGADQPVILQLLEITPALKALEGVVMELDDCAFPLLHGVVTSDDPNVAFKDADYAILVGGVPRKPGMERSDLLKANGGIFKPQGEALSNHANPNVKVLVVGNPANTNCLIACSNAPKLKPRQFTAMTRLDHNRAVSQIALKLGKRVTDVKKMSIWGNHSTTQYPNLVMCEVDGKSAASQVDQKWIEEFYIPKVAKRGAEVLEARGFSSAASAANAAIDHMRDWALGSSDWVSMASPSEGSYGVAKGLVFSYPCLCKGGDYSIVEGLELDAFSQSKLKATEKELEEERSTVRELGLIP